MNKQKRRKRSKEVRKIQRLNLTTLSKAMQFIKSLGLQRVGSCNCSHAKGHLPPNQESLPKRLELHQNMCRRSLWQSVRQKSERERVCPKANKNLGVTGINSTLPISLRLTYFRSHVRISVLVLWQMTCNQWMCKGTTFLVMAVKQSISFG